MANILNLQPSKEGLKRLWLGSLQRDMRPWSKIDTKNLTQDVIIFLTGKQDEESGKRKKKRHCTHFDDLDFDKAAMLEQVKDMKGQKVSTGWPRKKYKGLGSICVRNNLNFY